MPACRILILDDDANLVNLYARVLRKANHEVQVVRSIKEAREKLAETTFDVFICDLKLKNENTMDYLQETRAFLHQKKTEVIVISGLGEFRTACQDLGVKHFLTKPISMRELTQEVNTICLHQEPN